MTPDSRPRVLGTFWEHHWPPRANVDPRQKQGRVGASANLIRPCNAKSRKRRCKRNGPLAASGAGSRKGVEVRVLSSAFLPRKDLGQIDLSPFSLVFFFLLTPWHPHGIRVGALGAPVRDCGLMHSTNLSALVAEFLSPYPKARSALMREGGRAGSPLRVRQDVATVAVTVESPVVAHRENVNGAWETPRHAELLYSRQA